jgi:hypothetical protein
MSFRRATSCIYPCFYSFIGNELGLQLDDYQIRLQCCTMFAQDCTLIALGFRFSGFVIFQSYARNHEDAS